MKKGVDFSRFSNPIVALTFFSLFTSCQKDAENTTSSSIVGKWKMSGYIHNGQDVYGTQVGTCVTDDILTFTDDNQVVVDEGPTKCSPADPQTFTTTYSLNADKSELTFIVPGLGPQTNDILILSQTTLQLKQPSNNDIVSYVRQP